MKEKEQRFEFFKNFADDLANHTSELTVRQIAELAKEDGSDVNKRASLLKQRINSMIMENRRERKLNPAQEKYSCVSRSGTFKERFAGKTIDDLKSIVLNHIPRSGALSGGFVFAGRNLDELTEDDLINVLEDMRDLGLIEDE